jgi:hypothetical protein
MALALGLLAVGSGCSVMVDTSGLSSGDQGATSSTTDDGGPGKTGGEIGIDATSAARDAALVLPDSGLPGPTPEAGGGSAGDSGAPSGDDAGETADANDAGSASPCGPTDTTANCGICGVSCDTTTGTPSCDGTRCSYTCNSGASDCNQGDLTSANTDGCECATPACCGASCETTHSNGVGQSYYDCLSPATFGSKAGMEACAAYAGNNAAGCSAGWTCNGDTTKYVCFSPDGGSSCGPYCWGYSGSGAGKVVDCTCPGNPRGTWN